MADGRAPATKRGAARTPGTGCGRRELPLFGSVTGPVCGVRGSVVAQSSLAALRGGTGVALLPYYGSADPTPMRAPRRDSLDTQPWRGVRQLVRL